jgi:hypothetical protein
MDIDAFSSVMGLCSCCQRHQSPRESHVHFNRGQAAMCKGHPGRALPSHEAEYEDEDKTGAHGERKERTAPSRRRQHHHRARHTQQYGQIAKRAAKANGDGVFWR